MNHLSCAIVVLVGCQEPAPTTPPGSPTAPSSPQPMASPDAAIDGPARSTADITFAAVGDLMLGSTFPVPRLPPRDGADFLADATPLLSAADLAFGNLEGPLYDGGTAPTCTRQAIAEKSRGRPGGTDCWAFRMPERFVGLLRTAGFDVVSVANNHVDDFGAAGRARTLQLLDGAGIAWSGPVGTVAHLHARGHAVDLIAFATYDGLNDLDDHRAAADLVAKSKADIVIVSFHGGAEGPSAQHVPERAETYFTDRRGAVKSFAHAMIDAGADLVIGHGPHVVRGMEVYRDRLIAYSLGTFASYGGIDVSGVLGLTLVLEVRLAADGRFVAGRINAVRQLAPGGPHLDPAAKILAIVRDLSRVDFGDRAVRIGDDGALTAP